jgi:hypothetical protein
LLELLAVQAHLCRRSGDVALVAAQGAGDKVTLEGVDHMLFRFFV